MANIQVVPKETGGLPVEWVAQELASMTARYPSFELPKASAAVYLSEIADLAREVGRERTHEAIVTAYRSNKFFPSVAELRDAAGLNPAKILACQQDRAWRVAFLWAEKYSTGRVTAGRRADKHLPFEAEAYWHGNPLPTRILYAIDACGDFDALKIPDAKDLSFIRQRFDSAFERFPMSEKAKPDNLDPFANGITDKELLSGYLVDYRGNRIPDDVKILSMCEWEKHIDAERDAEWKRLKADREADPEPTLEGMIN